MRRRSRSRPEVQRELQAHLDMMVEDLVARGVELEAAHREAARRFGAVDSVTGECETINDRRVRRLNRHRTMRALIDDLRHAWRSVVKSPTLTAVVSLTLMLGIGATTAIFSVVDQVLLRPLAYPSPERLVALTDDQGGDTPAPLSFPEFTALKTLGGDVFEDVGAYFTTGLTLTDAGEPRVLQGAAVSAGIPRLLGVRPLAGRVFNDAEDGITRDRAIMLSEQCWKHIFNSDPHIVGRTLTLAGVPFTVIGVYPSTPATRLPNELSSGRNSDYWQALRLDATRAPSGTHFMSAFGRLRRDVPLAAARTRLTTLRHVLQNASGTPHHPIVESLADRLLGPVKNLLGVFLCAVGLMLTIACANVAGLLIARGAVRQRELAVRSAIGASGGRIASQLLAESCLRALLGGVLGVGFAYVVVGVLRRSGSIRLPRMSDVHVDMRMLLFSLGLAIVVGVLCGAMPALRAVRLDLAAALRDGTRGLTSGLGRDRFRRALVSVEIALSFALLVGTGLLARSVQNLLGTNKGFNPDHVISASLSLPASRYPDDAKRIAAFGELLANIRATPGIEAAAFTSSLPVEGGTNGNIKVEGRAFANDQDAVAEKRIVSDGYFETVGATMAAGRTFGRDDAPGGPTAAIVNATFVHRFLDGAQPIGRRVDFAWDTKGMQSVVGVVADIKEQALNDARPVPAIYVPLAQRPTSFVYLVARTSGDPASMVPALRRAVLAVDQNLPLSDVRLVDDILLTGISNQRLAASLLAGFSVVALLLATVGLYGVINYSVVQRTQELGVRAALGASRGALLSLILRQGAGFVVVGLIVGAIIGRLGASLLASQLFGIAAGSSGVYALVAVLLGVVAVIAMSIPATRAARTDPLVALRTE